MSKKNKNEWNEIKSRKSGVSLYEKNKRKSVAIKYSSCMRVGEVELCFVVGRKAALQWVACKWHIKSCMCVCARKVAE